MLETVQTLLMNQEFARNFVSEMLCLYLVIMLAALAALMLVLIEETLEMDDF